MPTSEELDAVVLQAAKEAYAHVNWIKGVTHLEGLSAAIRAYIAQVRLFPATAAPVIDDHTKD